MRIRIPVTWEMYGMVKVEAESLSDAIMEFRRIQDELPLPENGSYIDDSFGFAGEDMGILRMYNPDVIIGD